MKRKDESREEGEGGSGRGKVARWLDGHQGDTRGWERRAGMILEVKLRNFMCHEVSQSCIDNVNNVWYMYAVCQNCSFFLRHLGCKGIFVLIYFKGFYQDCLFVSTSLNWLWCRQDKAI